MQYDSFTVWPKIKLNKHYIQKSGLGLQLALNKPFVSLDEPSVASVGHLTGPRPRALMGRGIWRPTGGIICFWHFLVKFKRWVTGIQGTARCCSWCHPSLHRPGPLWRRGQVSGQNTKTKYKILGQDEVWSWYGGVGSWKQTTGTMSWWDNKDHSVRWFLLKPTEINCKFPLLYI